MKYLTLAEDMNKSYAGLEASRAELKAWLEKEHPGHL
jgi:hypothetical protein